MDPLVPQPITASTLLAQSLPPDTSGRVGKQGRLRTGYEPLDTKALEGGLRFGIDHLVGLACESGFTHDLCHSICLALLTNFLLADENVTGRCFWISTPSQPFPASSLFRHLIAGLQRRRHQTLNHGGGYVYTRSGFGRFDDMVARMDEEKAEWARSHAERASLVDADLHAEDQQTAKSLMDRVSVMQVFELQGVLDCVAEMTDILKPTPTSKHQPQDLSPASVQPPEIADSQASTALSEDEAMQPLPDIQPPPPSVTTPTNANQHLAIIPALSALVGAEMHKNHVRAHALLVHLSRSLRALSHSLQPACSPQAPTSADCKEARSGLVAILGNSLVGGKPEASKTREEPEGASAFAHNHGARPALGRTLAHLLDVSVMVTAVGASTSRRTAERQRFLLEVLKDRHGTKVGMWAGFEVGSADGMVLMDTRST